jgi:FixJ family two-component response regulator
MAMQTSAAELQQTLARQHYRSFYRRAADVPISVRAMKDGATDFLQTRAR